MVKLNEELSNRSCISESKRFLGDFKLNPYKFSKVFKNPDDASDLGFSLKSLELEISNGPVDGFKVPIDTEFKTNYLKFQRSLHSLAPSGCPNISYEDYRDNTCFQVFDLTCSGGILLINIRLIPKLEIHHHNFHKVQHQSGFYLQSALVHCSWQSPLILLQLVAW